MEPGDRVVDMDPLFDPYTTRKMHSDLKLNQNLLRI